ncbi:hypothetical protein [uncultured Bdellovibrio sp.]|uniref:hypothetical protein n=1 Tax=Bdellovibrio sp. HCB-162 TaxID=3394234 RepID=UPI0025F5D47B|nr:hypothetical protein [uncultured Bdellovibrio sp.]
MTLKNSLLIAFAAITLTSISAGAYIVPGGPRPAEPAPYPDDGGFQPGNPFPGQDDFGNGGIGGIGNGGFQNGRQEQKIIYLNRRVSNETLALRQLAGIGENYRGYTIQSVIVDVRRSGPQAEVSLLADGREEDTAYSPQGAVQLVPRYRAVIGEDVRSLQLSVRGNAEIASITINLLDNDRVERPGRPGRGIDVPLYVSRRMYGNDRLDLTQYIDMYRYRGYRIQEIVIEATPVYNTALIDLVINGFNQGQTLQVDRYNSRQTVRPQNAVLGQGADSIVLYTRGDLDVRQVTLRLSR